MKEEMGWTIPTSGKGVVEIDWDEIWEEVLQDERENPQPRWKVILDADRSIDEQTFERANGMLHDFCKREIAPLFDAVNPSRAGRT
jgi:hypothetical protein